MRVQVVQILVILMALFAMVSAHTLYCADEDHAAPWQAISDGMHHIKNIEHSGKGIGQDGKATGEHGGWAWIPAHSCAKLYCNNGGAFFWCNEDKNTDKWMRVEHIREGLDTIAHECPKYPKEKKKWTGGVLDHPDNWSAVMRFDPAC
ncbi:hypothetical protein BDW74DRAFT_183205 [Aspergillus multicolor]|uniref:uncharacterized protein n=1 Tax=Aspergillus multicolor TaxID=41759 RepID=UPI003CCDF24F